MKKIYRVGLLILIFIILSTYTLKNPKTNTLENSDFFIINKVIITNNMLVKNNVVIEKLNYLYNKNIFFIKSKDIEKSLKDIDFLDTVELKKRYPSTLIIKIIETKPVAIIFKKKEKFLLDSSSNLIELNNIIDLKKLPSIFGNNAESNFVSFLKQLKNNNFPYTKIKSYYYFQIGRWDLRLTNNKVIKLPYAASNKIIKKSVELLNRNDFKNYNTIDLRVDGKIIVE